jgi:LDH2 family malate/lactate/ureidoglycolate dehydrogenase
LDIASFSPVRQFHDRMAALVAELKSGSRDGAEDVRYPGEIEDLAQARHAREGLVLPERTIADLRRVGDDVGVAVQVEGRA